MRPPGTPEHAVLRLARAGAGPGARCQRDLVGAERLPSAPSLQAATERAALQLLAPRGTHAISAEPARVLR